MFVFDNVIKNDQVDSTFLPNQAVWIIMKLFWYYLIITSFIMFFNYSFN